MQGQLSNFLGTNKKCNQDADSLDGHQCKCSTDMANNSVTMGSSVDMGN